MTRFAGIIGAVLILATCCSCGGAAKVDLFAGTTKIVLSRDVGEGKGTIEIADKAEIDTFLKTIVLTKKNPCLCDHIEFAVFTTPAREIRVSLCDHCFDFDGQTYAMPAAFYELFKAKLPK